MLLLGSISQPLASRSPGFQHPVHQEDLFEHQNLHARTMSATVLRLEDSRHSFGHFDTAQSNMTKQDTTTAMTSWLDSLPTSVDPNDKEMKRSCKWLCWFWRLTADNCNMSTCYTNNIVFEMGEAIFTCPKMLTFLRKKTSQLMEAMRFHVHIYIYHITSTHSPKKLYISAANWVPKPFCRKMIQVSNVEWDILSPHERGKHTRWYKMIEATTMGLFYRHGHDTLLLIDIIYTHI